MAGENTRQAAGFHAGDHRTESPGFLGNQVLDLANRGLSGAEFLCAVAKLLTESGGLDAVEIRVVERGRVCCCRSTKDGQPEVRTASAAGRKGEDGGILPCLDTAADLEILCVEIAERRIDPSLPFSTAKGSFFIGDTGIALELSSESCRWAGGRTLDLKGEFRSLAIINLTIAGHDRGLLLLRAKGPNYFTAGELNAHEELARILGTALAQLRGQIALRERIKELTCLYGIAQITATPGISLVASLQGIVELLPPAWLHPEVASARIILDGHPYIAPGFQEHPQRQTAPVVVGGQRRGMVEVAYAREMPELDEGPFLQEERSLIDAVAGEVALIIGRKESEEDRARLQEQIRHADRLATIGQLAAGVAHELNEPLGGILGFAQLALKSDAVAGQLRHDLERIVAAALHAREVVRKLLVFARESPPQKSRIDINKVVTDGLYFLRSRCEKAGIEVLRVLEPGLPEITADPNQLYQVLVNLAVNAIQAMPNGGRLTIRTAWRGNGAALIVEDSGAGIDQDVLGRIFLPFFTTKDISEGTGLGLAVVHGIVTSHGGTVAVESEVGKGTRFEVFWPADGPSPADPQRNNHHE